MPHWNAVGVLDLLISLPCTDLTLNPPTPCVLIDQDIKPTSYETCLQHAGGNEKLAAVRQALMHLHKLHAHPQSGAHLDLPSSLTFPLGSV